jgi:hypothetical protein
MPPACTSRATICMNAVDIMHDDATSHGYVTTRRPLMNT